MMLSEVVGTGLHTHLLLNNKLSHHVLEISQLGPEIVMLLVVEIWLGGLDARSCMFEET
jgi:hypothetical protein